MRVEQEYQLESEFSEIVKKAYEKGIHDKTITIDKFIDEIRADLLKMKIS